LLRCERDSIGGMDDRHAGTSMMPGQSAVHPKAFVDLLEQVGGWSYALCGPKDQHALGAKGIVEGSQHALLCHTLQINEQVSTAYEIQPREWRVVCHVLPREEAQIADVFDHAVLAVLLREESLEALGRDVVYGLCGVRTHTRLLQRDLTDIRTEDLDPGGGDGISEVFQEGNGDGVHLFATRASRHPDSERPLTRQTLAHCWKHVSA